MLKIRANGTKKRLSSGFLQNFRAYQPRGDWGSDPPKSRFVLYWSGDLRCVNQVGLPTGPGRTEVPLGAVTER